MLIELATGEPPNRGMDTAGVLHLIVNGDPFTLPSKPTSPAPRAVSLCNLFTNAHVRPQTPFRAGYATSSRKR